MQDELQSPSTFTIEPEESPVKSGKYHVARSWKAKRAMRKNLKQRIAIGHLTTEDFEKKDFWAQETHGLYDVTGPWNIGS